MELGPTAASLSGGPAAATSVQNLVQEHEPAHLELETASPFAAWQPSAALAVPVEKKREPAVQQYFPEQHFVFSTPPPAGNIWRKGFSVFWQAKADNWW